MIFFPFHHGWPFCYKVNALFVFFSSHARPPFPVCLKKSQREQLVSNKDKILFQVVRAAITATSRML